MVTGRVQTSEPAKLRAARKGRAPYCSGRKMTLLRTRSEELWSGSLYREHHGIQFVVALTSPSTLKFAVEEILRAVEELNMSLLERGVMTKKLVEGKVDTECNRCGKSAPPDGKLSTCSRCKLRAYCGKECQKVDWSKHKLECKKIAEDRKAAKQWRQTVKEATGTSTAMQKQMFTQIYSELESTEGFLASLRRVGSMVCRGKNLIDHGLVDPTHVFFIVNMTAWNVFKQSSCDDIKSTYIVEAVPPDFIRGSLTEEVIPRLKEEQEKIHVLDGFLWIARHECWEGANTLNIMAAPGSKLNLPPGTNLEDPMVKKSLQFYRVRNVLLSQALAVNAAPQIPLDLMNLASQNPPNWKALANNDRFRSIVEQKPFGVLSRRTDGTHSNGTALVTLFVNAKILNAVYGFLEQEMENQLSGKGVASTWKVPVP
jgi:hypothetical protein